MKHIRLRVREGRIEPVEPIRLVEGAEFEATVPVPDDVTQVEPGQPPIELDTWDLGPMERVTRAGIYEDVI